MITEVKGNLLEAKVDMILSAANCFCTHGAGLAKQIKSKFPEAYIADLGTRIADPKKLGTVLPVEIDKPINDIKVICLCYSQFRFGTERRHTNYEAIYQCLEKVKEYSRLSKFTRIGCPKYMASRLAGGSWHIVRAMLEEVFGGDPLITLIICEYP